MKTVIFLLLLIPIVGFSQKTDVYVKLTDSSGQQIKGESVMKGFERWIGATTINTGGKNNTQITFTMPVSGASADLKRALANGAKLPGGQISVLTPSLTGGSPVVSYIIKMENIMVSSCSEAMGCNSVMNTSVTLQVTRIGWTYYQTDKSGMQTVSRKFGWDAASQGEWTNF
jgi:type VI protein secretion system component Hcp